MNFSAIEQVTKRANLRERVSESLSGAIVSGELAPGTLVSVPTLAAEFGVSATPVREAMLELEKRGFVHSVPNKGFRVTEVHERDLREILEIRALLEAPIMAALADRIPENEMPHWRSIADRISEFAEAGNLTAFIEADRDFHLGLLSLHGNTRLVAMVKELRSQTRMVGLAKMTHSPELSATAREHYEMLDLIVQGDVAGLHVLMQVHVNHVMEWWGPGNDG